MTKYYINIIILCATFKGEICEIIHRTVLIITTAPISCFVKFLPEKSSHCVIKNVSLH